MTLYMQTTKISAEQTAAKIQNLLGMNGAKAIMSEFEKCEVVALSFKIEINGREIPFRLPIREEPIFKHLYTRVKNQKKEREQEIREQAKRVAWRQILRWLEAQLALTQTGMAYIKEVFMPYIQIDISGQTLYQRMSKDNFQALEYKK